MFDHILCKSGMYFYSFITPISNIPSPLSGCCSKLRMYVEIEIDVQIDSATVFSDRDGLEDQLTFLAGAGWWKNWFGFFGCVTSRRSVHQQHLNIQDISISCHCHVYTQQSSKFRDGIDPVTHQFSTRKLENVYSTFCCAGVGQCRAAARQQK